MGTSRRMDPVAYAAEHPEVAEIGEAFARESWTREELRYLLEIVRLGEKPHPDAVALFFQRAG